MGAAGLATTLNRLLESSLGALALSGDVFVNDIDLIFAPVPSPCGRRPRRGSAPLTDSGGERYHAPPMDKEFETPTGGDRKTQPRHSAGRQGLLAALHYRLAPHAEKAIYEAVSLIRADLPNAPIEGDAGNVCEIKHSGFNKASGVIELMRLMKH